MVRGSVDTLTKNVNVICVSDNKESQKQEKVLTVAQQIFLRFGYRRTTMQDIAKATDISRPALYLIYPNKEAIFRAVIIRYYEQIKLLSEQEIQVCHTLEKKLAACMENWIEMSYQEISNSPAENEIYEARYTIVEDLKEPLSQIFIDQLCHILETSPEIPPSQFKEMDITPLRMAELIAKSCIGLRREAQTLEQLQSWLRDLRKIHLSALNVS
jgi:AcrR family transcriptional regulator